LARTAAYPWAASALPRATLSRHTTSAHAACTATHVCQQVQRLVGSTGCQGPEASQVHLLEALGGALQGTGRLQPGGRLESGQGCTRHADSRAPGPAQTSTYHLGMCSCGAKAEIDRVPVVLHSPSALPAVRCAVTPPCNFVCDEHDFILHQRQQCRIYKVHGMRRHEHDDRLLKLCLLRPA